MTDLLAATIAAIAPLDAAAMRAAEARQDQLTKPRKALGRLETLSIQLAGIQGKTQPVIEQKAVAVMAADHGVDRRGRERLPGRGHARHGLQLRGRRRGHQRARPPRRRPRARHRRGRQRRPVSAAAGIRHKKIRMGTANMAQGPAMTPRRGRARHRGRHRAGRGGARQGPRRHRHRRDGHRQHHGRLGRHRRPHRRARRRRDRPRHRHQRRRAAGQDRRHREGAGREPARRAATPSTCSPRSAASRSPP